MLNSPEAETAQLDVDEELFLPQPLFKGKKQFFKYYTFNAHYNIDRFILLALSFRQLAPKALKRDYFVDCTYTVAKIYSPPTIYGAQIALETTIAKLTKAPSQFQGGQPCSFSLSE